MAMRAPFLIAVAVVGLLTSCEDDSAYRLRKNPYNTTGGPTDGSLDGMAMSVDGAPLDAGTGGGAGGVMGRGGSGGGGIGGMAGRGGASGAGGSGGAAGGSGGTADAGLPDIGAPTDDAATD